jgi:hypothetical protein
MVECPLPVGKEVPEGDADDGNASCDSKMQFAWRPLSNEASGEHKQYRFKQQDIQHQSDAVHHDELHIHLMPLAGAEAAKCPPAIPEESVGDGKEERDHLREAWVKIPEVDKIVRDTHIYKHTAEADDAEFDELLHGRPLRQFSYNRSLNQSESPC